MRGRIVGISVLLLAVLAPLSARATTGTDVGVRATVGGVDVAAADANSPLPLHPSDDTVVAVTVTNKGSQPLLVRSVRLDAKVLGLVFFSYTTRVDLTVPPGGTGARTFSLDLSDLDGQAIGLMPLELSLVAPDRTSVATVHATGDVKGRLLSVYGVFGLALAGITALLVLLLVIQLVRRTLPDSRWSRALLVAVPGLGLGMVAVFTLGVLRVLVPSTGTALVLLAAGLVVGLVLGYLTPNPADEADRDELDTRDVVAVQEAPVPAPVVTAPTYAPATEAPPTARETTALPRETFAADPSDVPPPP